ncbi:hypothetical protein ACO0R3_001769 [Hanseniaspora guilliermondii]
MVNGTSLKEVHKLIETINPTYNIFNKITSLNELLKQQKNTNKPVVRYALKDNIASSDLPMTCSSKILMGFQPKYDATVTHLLKKQDNWVNLGKLNLDEFGMGSGGVHSSFGPVKNPLYNPIPESVMDSIRNNTKCDVDIDYSENRVTGGSSSGSTALASAIIPKSNINDERIAHFTLGTDTGGSVRLPAAWCNISSFKPSYGRISRFGVVPYAQSLDTVGILSADVNTIETAYDVLNQYDPKDPTSMNESIRNELSYIDRFDEIHDFVSIGVIQEFNISGIPNSTNEIYTQVLSEILSDEKNFDLKSVSIEKINESLPIYFTIAPAEASSNLARFDGIRYGPKVEDKTDVNIFENTRNLFGDEVQKRILLGNYNLSSEVYEDKFKKAQILRTELIEAFNNCFKDKHPLYNSTDNMSDKVDVLISLTGVDKAPLLSEFLSSNSVSPLDEFCNDVFTIPMSLAGLPCISIPIRDTGISIQITGQYGYDKKVLGIAKKIKSKFLD